MSVWEESCIFSPSLICLDMCNLESQMRVLEQSGIGMLHVDILDGHFSPSMPLGLMTDPQEFFIDELLDIGVQQIVFQAETQPHLDGAINKIHARGVKAGVALKPATPLSELEYVLEKCDTVLLMLINPGYASVKGESQVPYADRKIAELRKMIDRQVLPTKIEIDGRVSMDNIRRYGKHDVDIFVTGSTCLKRDALAESLGQLGELRKTVLE